MRSTLILTSFLVACGSGGGEATPDAAGGADGATDLYLPAGTSLTPFLSAEPEREFAAAGEVVEAGVDYLAVIESDQGRLVIDLHEADTPVTVNSFVWLALHHYFDGIAFHRVIDGFMAQTGDPNTLASDPSQWGTGGPGYEFGLEVVAGLGYDAAGVVGMARGDSPDSNGSQFFITVAEADFLDGDYTVFGRLAEGLDVLPQIVRGEPPADPTRMVRVHVVERPR